MLMLFGLVVVVVVMVMVVVVMVMVGVGVFVVVVVVGLVDVVSIPIDDVVVIIRLILRHRLRLSNHMTLIPCRPHENRSVNLVAGTHH